MDDKVTGATESKQKKGDISAVSRPFSVIRGAFESHRDARFDGRLLTLPTSAETLRFLLRHRRWQFGGSRGPQGLSPEPSTSQANQVRFSSKPLAQSQKFMQGLKEQVESFHLASLGALNSISRWKNNLKSSR